MSIPDRTFLGVPGSITPLVLKGDQARSNVAVACSPCNLARSAKAWPQVGFNPHGDDPEPEYPCGLMIVYVSGVTYLGTVALTKTEVSVVEAEDVVADDDLDDAAR